MVPLTSISMAPRRRSASLILRRHADSLRFFRWQRPGRRASEGAIAAAVPAAALLLIVPPRRPAFGAGDGFIANAVGRAGAIRPRRDASTLPRDELMPPPAQPPMLRRRRPVCLAPRRRLLWLAISSLREFNNRLGRREAILLSGRHDLLIFSIRSAAAGDDSMRFD